MIKLTRQKIISLCLFFSLFACESEDAIHENKIITKKNSSINNDQKLEKRFLKFYVKYIKASELCNSDEMERLKNNNLTGLYRERLKKMKPVSDPILYAQNASRKWLPTLRVQKDESEDQEYLVSYRTNHSNKKVELRITACDTKSGYLIDNIEVNSKPTLVGLLNGVWRLSCDNYPYLKISDNKALIAVNSNQIYLNAIIKRRSKTVYDILLDSPNDLGRGGVGLDWVNYSRDSLIAQVNTQKTSVDIIFNWFGFYNKRLKKWEWTNKSDFQLESKKNNDILLRKCGCE